MADTSYSSLQFGGEFKIGTTLTSASSIATGASNGTVLAAINTGAFSYNVVCFGIVLSTSISGGTDVVLTLKSLPTQASDSTNARTIGTLTIPSASVADDVVVNYPTDNLQANPGERLLLFLTTKSSGNGAGHVFIHGYPTVTYPTGKTGTYDKVVATAAGDIRVV